MSADPSTYRDLLLFEERLKTNAANLQNRKSRYQLFLLHLLLAISLLLAEVLLLQPSGSSIIAFPHAFIVSRLFPDAYDPAHPMILNPYLATGLLFVGATTLVLFFASGMYRDKIAYANRYVPQANRALRSFNMYLNVRKPPFTARFSIPVISWLRRSSPASPVSSRPSSDAIRSRSRSPSASASHPLNPIPPASNPRGELIFSSRISKPFREGYEKHRSAFERRREERERRDTAAKSFNWKALFGRKDVILRETSPSSAPARNASVASSGSMRGRLSRSTTPEHMPRRDGSRSPPKNGSLRRKQLETTLQSRR